MISRVYTTKLQDRIIKLEMKLRFAQLLSPAQQAMLARLSLPQVVALRFASDSELPALVERADRDRLTADQIKTSDHQLGSRSGPDVTAGPAKCRCGSTYRQATMLSRLVSEIAARTRPGTTLSLFSTVD